MATEAERIAQWKAQLANELSSDDDDLDHMASAMPPREPDSDSDSDDDMNDVLNQTTPDAIGQFETAEEFNAMLLIRLEQQEDEITHLRRELKKKPAVTINPDAPDAHKTKALMEQTKKNRALTQTLGRERSRIANLTTRVKELEREVSKAKAAGKGKGKGAASSGAAGGKSAGDGKEKELKQLNSKVADQRIQITSLKAELQRTQRALQREVGDDTSVATILSQASNWKGRAEQISLLRDQLRDAKRNAAGGPPDSARSTRSAASTRSAMSSRGGVPSSARSTASNSVDRQRAKIGQIDGNRRAEVDRLTAELQLKKEDYQALKTKYAAATSRVKILESEMKKLKSRIGVLLEKSDGDDKLVNALRAQLDKFRSKKGGSSAGGASSHRVAGAGTARGASRQGSSDDSVADMLHHYKVKYDELTQQVSEQQDIIEQLRRHRGGNGGGKPPLSGAAPQSAAATRSHAEAIYREGVVQRVTLELEQAKKAADLYRRKFEHASENPPRSNSGVSSPSERKKGSAAELHDKIGLLQDENNALKITLESTSQARDQEMGLYKELMEEHRELCDNVYNELCDRLEELG